MQNSKFFYNAALVFGLVAASPAFADEVATVNPATMTQQEREAYRASMTDQQRAEMQASHRQNGSALGQGQGTMARDGSGMGGQYGRSGGMGGGRGRGGR